jgi:hypothetical protein
MKVDKKEKEIRRAEKWTEGLGRMKSPAVKKFFTLFLEGRGPAMEALGIERDFMINEIGSLLKTGRKVHETGNVENIKQSGDSKKLVEKRESKIRVRADFMVNKTIKSGTELLGKVKTSLKKFWKSIRSAVVVFNYSLFCVKSIVCVKSIACQLSQCETTIAIINLTFGGSPRDLIKANDSWFLGACMPEKVFWRLPICLL